MRAPLDPALVDQVADRIAAGDSNGRIAELLDLGRNQLAGIIARLRKGGDPRVPAAGGRGTPVTTAAEQRDAVAEAFANGAVNLAAAARSTGLTLTVAQRRWSEICTNLGWQAQ